MKEDIFGSDENVETFFRTPKQPPKNLKEIFESLAGIAPEIAPGIDKRKRLAAEFSKLDSSAIGRPESELLPLYEEMAFNICTDDLLEKVFNGSTAEQRWKMVEPLTWMK